MEEIVNKVAQSGLISIDIKDYYPSPNIAGIDLKGQLYQGLVLKEKDFRNWCKDHDWQSYKGVHVALYCSAEAIIPTWAFMLVAQYLENICSSVYFGNATEAEKVLVSKHFEQLDVSEFKDQRIIIKGCSEIGHPEIAFIAFTSRLKPVVKSLMFGEACSSVPIYKRK